MPSPRLQTSSIRSFHSYIFRCCIRGAFAAAMAVAANATAEVKLPAIFSDHAVLQKSAATAVWGWAAPGEKVTVTFGAASAHAVTDAEGRWRVFLDLSEAGPKAENLVVHGTNEVTVADVIVGEVWLASGQSNMQMPLNATSSLAAEQALPENTRLRWFVAQSGKTFLEPQENVEGRWFVAGPGTVAECPAVPYFFGKKLAGVLQRPVGLVMTAVGGTAIQSWISAETIAKVEALGAPTPGRKKKKMPPILTPSFYFNQLIHPLAALSFRGIIWYQGEAHFSQGAFYREAFPALIRDWRRHFGNKELPFYFCQLPNLDKKTADANNGGWVAEVREAQDAGLKEKNTGEAVLIDVGGEDLHPQNKEVVGERLANLAEAGTYGMKVISEGPRFAGLKGGKGRLMVTFAHCEGGLVAGNPQSGQRNEVQGFALCGPDGRWTWARAEISGDTVIVSSPEVPDPVAVRYAWANNPTCNLFNKAGLPAAPFRAELKGRE